MNLITLVQQTKYDSPKMAQLSETQKNQALTYFAEIIKKETPTLLKANALDTQNAKNQISESLYQRLILNEDKINTLVQGIKDLVSLKDPCHRVISKKLLDDGLVLTQVTVPLGVIAVIFESRPDVIPQVLSLMLKSGNCCLLKGGKEALHTNKAFMDIVKKVNETFPFLPPKWASLLETREEIHELLSYDPFIDLVIPRGSNEFVQFIKEHTKIPVLGHADGVCHIYVDESADLNLAQKVILDAKAQYPSACNAVETLLVHAHIAKDFLPKLETLLAGSGIKIFVCPQSLSLFKNAHPVTDWHIEYSDLQISIKIVTNTEEAIDHINTHGSHHTDAILSNNKNNVELFKALVDSASVMVNSSTRFADGFRYGLGAEVGISTNKTHARGPVGLDGLIIYKFILEGQGHIVSDYSGKNAKHFKHIDLI